ncbi:hypothetical protein [Candidatus Hamiltonella defensa]|uniref:hypothetical protein n=1 Tax=Candidatus Williamhamiltonella defendens TaxID=138072 RepID=UPI001F1F7A0E|nr:hypothetical protein [Candidatus Hamiltonella defensa]
MKHSSLEIFIIDDYQHVLVNELMSRSSEKSYDKFTDIGKHTWLILNTASWQRTDAFIFSLTRKPMILATSE